MDTATSISNARSQSRVFWKYLCVPDNKELFSCSWNLNSEHRNFFLSRLVSNMTWFLNKFNIIILKYNNHNFFQFNVSYIKLKEIMIVDVSFNYIWNHYIKSNWKKKLLKQCYQKYYLGYNSQRFKKKTYWGLFSSKTK